MTTARMPKAKTERLIVREIDGETLVYDHSRDAASCLNEFAARVWRDIRLLDRRRAGRGRTRRLAGAASTDESAVADRSYRVSPRHERRQEPPRDRGAVGVGRGGVRHQHRRGRCQHKPRAVKVWTRFARL
jgi:hypothetical protein